MLFAEIKTFTYIGTSVAVDGRTLTVPTALAVGIDAVQYHSGHAMLEEPLMKEVKTSKYKAILDEWAAARDLADTPPPEVVLTDEDKINNVKFAVQTHLDNECKALGFDNTDSISKFMSFPNVYQADAVRLAQYVVDVWVYTEAEFANILAGARTIPTPEEAVLELPAFI